MKKLLSLALLCTLPLVSCAEIVYRADVGAMFPNAGGRIALKNSAGDALQPGNKQDLDSNLGLGDTEASPYVQVQGDMERHRVRVDGFYSRSDGSGTLNAAGGYGDIPAGTPVTTSMEFYAVRATYAYQLLRDDHWRLAAGGALGIYGLDIAARSAAIRESVQTSLVVPMPYLEAEAFLGPVILGADGALMYGDFGDGDGRYGDVEAYVKVRPSESFELFAGYRYVVLDAHGRATSRDFDADVDFDGLFFGGGVRF